MILNKYGMTLLLCLALIVAAGAFALPDSAQACSCAASSGAEERVNTAMQHSTVIFAGKVTEIVPPPRKPLMSTADEVKVHFEVTKVWKGMVNRDTIVHTAISSSSCGYTEFAVGTEFLVTAGRAAGKLSTGICSMTLPLVHASPELGLLGAGHLPLANPQTESAGDTGSGFNVLPIVLVSAAVAIAAIGFLLLVKRNRRKSG